jgi:hypothetical protein
MLRIWTLVLVMACGAPVWGQAIQAPGTPATGPYEDTASGVVFPVSAGAFQRFRLARSDAQSISAGYMHIAPSERVAATVFVDHPPGADGLCRKMADADRAVAGKRAGVLFELVPPVVAGWDVAGFAANGGGGMGSQEHYYYCRDGWVVQFNFQHPPDLDAEALETAFLVGFPLPEKH